MRSLLIDKTGFSSNIPADFTHNLVLAAGIQKTISRSQFPEWATHAFVMHSHDVNANQAAVGLFMKANGQASIPTQDILDGSGMAVDVSNCYINLLSVSSLSFICPVASVVALCFYRAI